MSSEARLSIRRPPPGGAGDSYPITLWVDGQKVGKLMPGEAVTAALDAGPHDVRGHNTLLARTVRLQAQPGEEIRLVVRNGTNIFTVLLGFLGTGPAPVLFERE